MKRIFSFFAAILFAGSMMAESYTKTAFADISADDVVIIVGENASGVYAMSNDQGTGNAPKAVAVEVSDEVIETDATNILWNVVRNDDGSFAIYPDGESEKWLYCTATNNGVRVGTNEGNMMFSIDAASGYLFNNATSRYLGIYNSQDWRCYTSINNNIKEQSFAFYVVGSSPVGVKAPVIKPDATTFEESVTVSISCATEGASIFYTLDEETPSENAMVYLSPFTLTETTTVKAIAIAGEASSSIITKKYTKVDPSALVTCSDVYSLADDAEAKLNEVVVTYVSGKNVWVKDNSAALYLYLSSNASFAAGDKLQGVAGKKTTYKGLVELTDIQLDAIEATAGEAPAPEELSAIDENKDMSKYVILKNVAVSGPFDDSKKLTLTLGNDQYELFNKFSIDFTFDAAKTYDVRCIVSKYNTLQLNFVSAEEAGGEPPVITLEDGFYLIGQNGWNEAALNENLLFALNPEGDGGEYMLDVKLVAGQEIKVVEVKDNAIVNWFPGGDAANYTVDAEHAGNKTVYFRPAGWNDWYAFHEGGFFYIEANEPVDPNQMYVWDGVGSETEATELGGTAEIVPATETTNLAVGAKQNGNFCLKINKGYTSSGGPYFIGITLDEAVNAGDEVRVIYFRTKETSTYVLGMDFSADAESASDTYQILSEGDPQVFTSTEALEEVTFVVPDGVENAKYMRVYRRNGSTGVWIPKLQLVKGSEEPAIKASDIALGDIKTEGDVYETELTLRVKGENLESPIEYSSSNSELVAVSGDLDETGGTLTVNISVPATEEGTELNETITLISDNVVKEIAVTAIVKKVAPVVPGDCYTLTFTYYDKTDGDGGAKLNTKEAIFDAASQDYIDTVLVGTQVYAGRKYKDVASGDSIFSNLKLGTGTAAAQLKFALANPTEVEKIIFRAAMYSDTEGAEGFTVNDSEPFALSGGKLVFADYEWIPEGEVSTIDINQVKANKGRFYLTSITICPKSDSGEPAIKASDIDLGEVKTEDDVYETELTLEVKGENLDSPIAFESSNSELVAVSGQLDETGGTLTVNISVPATEEGTVLNETITLTSGNVVKEVAVTAIVKKVVPVIPTGNFVKVNSVPESWEGDYLIVYEAGSVALNGGLEKLDVTDNHIAVTITEGVIEATDETMAAIFSIEALPNGFGVKAANGKYIGIGSYSNGLTESENPFPHNTPSLDEDGNAILSISGEEWAGDMTIRFNKASNQNRFRYYKSGQEPIALYKLSEASDEPAILAANIALGEIETESDVYETELTLTVKGKNLDSPISFESSNSEIVAVSGQLGVDGGTLTVNIAAPASEEGTELNETITLTSDNVVKVVSVTAVVKRVVPVPPTGKKYILADIENIAPDQSVIIAMETNYGAKAAVNVFALSSANGASAAPAAVSVTAEDGAIITDATDIFWNIAKNEDGNYIIYQDGTTDTWLYCTNQNNGVRVGTGDANTFDIQQADEAQGGGMYLHNIGNNRYLGIYNSQDWRCYGSVNSNIKNQNLRFYVYSGTTAIDNTEVMEKATKFIQNGHLFIIKGDRIYNVMGQIIR